MIVVAVVSWLIVAVVSWLIVAVVTLLLWDAANKNRPKY